jgi:site-specific DNA-cytosine methylase
MGWSDYDFNRLGNNISDTALYRLAGNAVVVQVLVKIFKQLHLD